MNRRTKVLSLFLSAFLCTLYQVSSSSTPATRSPDHSLSPIQAVAISPHDRLYAATFGLGIFASSDGGQTWHAANANLSNQNVLAVAIKNHGLIFVGTFGGGVYRSDNDSGQRWLQVNSGLDCREVTCLETGEGGDVYAGTSSGQVYHSPDNGESWQCVGELGEYVTTMAVSGNGEILAGTSHGIRRTSDGGRNWVEADAGLTCKDVWSLALDQRGYAFAATNGGGVYRSLDNGRSWVQANTGLASRNAGSVAVCAEGKLFVGTTRGVFVSSDDGESWSSFVSSEPDNVVRCLTVGPNGQLLVGSEWVNIFKSNPVDPIPEEGT